MFQLLFCVFSCFVIGSQSAVAPYITPCKIGDNACVTKSAQATIPHVIPGLPELGVPSLEPLLVNELNGDTGDLKLQFRDLKITGLSKCNIVSAAHPDKGHIEFVAECPIETVGKYTAGGKLTVVPVEGDGNFQIKTDKIQFYIKVVVQEEKDHWSIASFDYTYDPVEQVHFNFENLFNGDEVKSKSALEILNHSWREVLLGVGKPIIDKLVVHVKDIVNKFFDGVPASELYIA